MKKNACLLYLLLITISACTNTQSRRVQTDEIYIAQSGEKVLKMSELVKNIRYVKLETTSDNLIGTVSQLIPLKNKYLVVDNSASKQVLLFDATGRFITRISRVGVAPGEYVTITSVAVDEEEERIFIADMGTGNILVYDMRGEYLDKISVDFSVKDIVYVGSNKMACYCDYMERKEQDGQVPILILYDLRTGDKQILLSADSRISPQEIVHANQSMYKAANGASLAYPLDPNIYLIDSLGIQQKIYVNWGEDFCKKRERYVEMLKEEEVPIEEIFQNRKTNFPNLLTVLCSDDFFCILYNNLSEMKIGVGFYNFQSQNYIGGYAMERFPIKNDIDSGFYINPIAIKGHDLYTIIESYSLSSVEPKVSELADLKEKVSGDDNPIIMITEMKIE